MPLAPSLPCGSTFLELAAKIPWLYLEAFPAYNAELGQSSVALRLSVMKLQVILIR
jgi:hypothetical protein